MNKLKELPFTSYHPSYEFLAFYRIFFSLFLLWIGISDNSWIHSVPSSAMQPPVSILSFTDFIPSEFFFVSCRFIMHMCLLLIFIGYRPRIFAITYMVLYLVTNNYAYSFGKINHDFIYTLPVLVMAFSPWNKVYSFFPEPKQETDYLAKSWPIFMMSLIFSFGMFTAGFAKILGGWLSLDTQYTQIFFNKYRYIVGWRDLLSDFYNGISSRLFWEILDYFTVIFETVFIVSFLHPKFFRSMLIVVILFHVNVLLMLNISFSFSVGLYTLFIPAYLFPAVFRNKIKTILANIFNHKYKLIAVILVILYLLLLGFLNISSINFLINKVLNYISFTFGKHSVPLIIMGGYLLLALYLLTRSWRKFEGNSK